MFRCDVCKDWGKDNYHLHSEEDIVGLLEEYDITSNEGTRLSEQEELFDGSIVYRYIQNENDLALINSSQSLASKALCLCKECLEYSLSFVPHYGDGAYCTSNENLKKESPRIVHTHGIDIRGMNYRIILKINRSDKFKKVKHTAGVIKSKPIGKQLKVDSLVFTDDDDIKVIGYQKWNGDNWEDILLEDLKGVS